MAIQYSWNSHYLPAINHSLPLDQPHLRGKLPTLTCDDAGPRIGSKVADLAGHLAIATNGGAVQRHDSAEASDDPYMGFF